jgi:hypothetical protein
MKNLNDIEDYKITLYLTDIVLGDKNASREERNKNLIIRKETLKEWAERFTK